MSSEPYNPVAELARLREGANASGDPAADYGILATLDPEGFPCMRGLTIRGFDPYGITFHVNAHSPKMTHLAANGRAEVLFFWPKALVQVRLRGDYTAGQDQSVVEAWRAKPSSSKAADLLHAELLPQSSVVASRTELLSQYGQAVELLRSQSDPPASVVALRFIPKFLEFWQCSPSDRMHERFRCSLADNAWVKELLVP